MRYWYNIRFPKQWKLIQQHNWVIQLKQTQQYQLNQQVKSCQYLQIASALQHIVEMVAFVALTAIVFVLDSQLGLNAKFLRLLQKEFNFVRSALETQEFFSFVSFS